MTGLRARLTRVTPLAITLQRRCGIGFTSRIRADQRWRPGHRPAIGIAIAIDKLDKLVIVYPNNGERWDGRAWTGQSRFSPGLAAQWMSAGARIAGGSCRGAPDIAGIAALATALGR
jgi:hypothetical protein